MTITYDDKEAIISNPNPTENKWTADDANEVKTVVNTNAIGTSTPSIAGGTIDLPMTNQEMIFILGNIGVIKTYTFSNDKAKKFTIKMPMTALVAQTFPASVVMSDSRWNGTSWTPDEIGTYYGTAVFDGTNWFLSIPTLPAS